MSDFVKPVLLTDEEFRELLKGIVTRNGMSGRIPELLEDELDKLTEFFKDQKIAHANMVIGEIEKHEPKCRQYRLTHQTSGICICNVKQRNNLRLEQRERNIEDVK